MNDRKLLKGITWGHSRGLLPMVATAQRFTELHPNIEIQWEKRSLQAFADFSVEELALTYDLLVIDHPWAGFSARTNIILPLDKFMDAAFLEDQKLNSVGRSYESYTFDGHLWALPIDAATPVASSRADLLKKHQAKVPKTYVELLALAEKGLVGIPLIPIDTLMAFYMFCCSLGEDPCLSADRVISQEVGTKALHYFKQLADKVDRRFFTCNPIQVYEMMTNSDQIAYCPFAYGYSNYARFGYAAETLQFHDLVSLEAKTPMRSTLGGTGLAISSNSKYIEEAVQYAHYAASTTCQQSLYFDAGGQPGHLKAWKASYTNRQTANYFYNTLPALERAFLRPRYHGHMFFQDHAGDVVRDYLLNGGDTAAILDLLNEIYHESKTLA